MKESYSYDMIKLVSIGDRFPHGCFVQISSIHDEAVNFQFKNQVVSIVTPLVGAGPFKIVLEGMNPSSVRFFEHKGKSVLINAEIDLNYTEKEIYKSDLDYAETESDIVSHRIYLLQQLLSKSGQQSSLSFLLENEPALKEMTSFEQELAAQFKQAYKLLLNSDFKNAAKGFQGRGYGLTPAGDDFNAGLLIGLWLRQQSEKKELSKIRSCIYHNSLGKNLLVNTFLLQAERGWLDEKWKKLGHALSVKPDELETALQGVLAQGETSGADTLTGFLSAWKIKI